MLSSQNLVERYKQAKNEGRKTRDTLRNVTIGLNNLRNRLDPKRMTPTWYEDATKEVSASIDEITQVLFGVHVEDIKKFITEEVIGSLKQALSIAKTKKDAEGVQYAVYVASDRLRSAVEMLEKMPDLDEKKERLARTLHMLLPSGNFEENWYEDAIKLAKQIAADEKGKAKTWFEGLVDGLEKGLAGYKDLRAGAAFAYKYLPKAK